jgi:ATP-binding protein involved in chromosome partitioning
VASGKGGVGKSSITCNLAVALAARGHTVGLLDADVYGYSIPRMMGATQQPVMLDDLIIPVESHGVRMMSIGFMTADDNPVIWRGPMLHKALTSFVTEVFWDEPDVLLVDLPPGTGDVSLSLAQLLPTASVLVVTTPQLTAQRVARRAAAMADRVELPVIGVVENMSWFVAPDTGVRYEVFSGGGGAALAEGFEGFLDAAFGPGIDGAGCLIKNQNVRVGQGGADKADQLALALAQVSALRANFGVISLGKL